MPADPKLVRDHFLAAAELPAAERSAYLSANCGADAELRAAVERLLAAHEQPASVLNQPAPGMPTAAYAPISEKPGTMVGKYKLMEQIGEGGFGLVFVAEQQEPVKRKVALKVIKPGMDSRQVISRFEAERQALALMDHPNIARVLDAGATDSGRPYFVMELVRGIPITEYCDKNQLTPKDRLELFVSVCQAVQHAHQKGIIHRDLKPSNVLVTSHDGKPVAKIIDFGVAKAIHQHLTERTIYTQFAQMIGTPLYMSPEQAEMSGLDIDTRSDIYSLGVLLYELLTGTTPLEKKRFAQAAYDEIRRMIREEEPPRPSTRLSQSGDSLPSIAAQRHTEPAKLSKLVRGDLDWITMKCLEKDRTRRYETANGLARDIERHLNDEPVEACPPSVAYRLRKLTKKHRAALTTAAGVALLLVAGVAFSSWQAVRATQQRDRAVTAEKVAEDRLRAVTAEKLRADREETTARTASEFLHLILSQASPESQPDRNIKLSTVLDQASQMVDNHRVVAQEPLVEASLRFTIGTTYASLGLHQKAERHLERCRNLSKDVRGPEHPQTVRAMNNLAELYKGQEKYDEAQALKAEVLAIRNGTLGEADAETLLATSNLADLYRIRGKYQEAESMLAEALAVCRKVRPPDHTDVLGLTFNLATVYAAQQKYDKAEEKFKHLQDTFSRSFGPRHPNTLSVAHNLAVVYREWGKHAEAEREFSAVYEKRKSLLMVHPDVAVTLGDWGLARLYRGKYTEAEEPLRECLRSFELFLPNSWQVFHARSMLGGSLLGQGKYAEAKDLLLGGYQGMTNREAAIPADDRGRLTQALERLVRYYEVTDRAMKRLKWRATLKTRQSAEKRLSP